MEIRQLKYFVSIAETGSFSEASRQCYLSQPAISQQIRALEEELNTTLFTRTPHKVLLTDCGSALLPKAKSMLKMAEECVSSVNNHNKMLCGELNVGLTGSAESYVRPAVMSFFKKYPKVRLNILYKTIPELINLLRDGKLDLAISIIVKGEEDWVESVPLIKYRHCAVMRDTHPLADRHEVSFRDLAKQKLILPEFGQKDMNAIERFLNRNAGELNVQAVINDACALLNLLKRTNCVSILPEQIIEGIDELVAVQIEELRTPVVNYVHTLKNAYSKKSAEAFIRELKKGEYSI